MMKKFLSVILGIIICTYACLSISASDNNISVIEIENMDTIFNEDSVFSNDQKQKIAEFLVYGNSDIQTYGLMCTLFGHKYTTETVQTITHCVYSSAPRCLRQKYEVSICSRCDATEQTLISEQQIYCCN